MKSSNHVSYHGGQEMARFNRLLQQLTATLKQLQKACVDTIVLV